MHDAIAFANALGDETRWRIVHLLAFETLCVCELADVLKLPQSTLSSHLGIIQRAGLISAERRGKWMFYRVAGDVLPVLRVLFDHFDCSTSTVPVLGRDAAKAETRIARRDRTCCPAPVRKAARRTPTSKITKRP